MPHEPSQNDVTKVSRIAADHGLPLQPDLLLGRQLELDLIRRTLLRGGVRLLTLTGPGGVGKSRLAAEAARLEAPAFPGGVWLVDIAAREGLRDVLEAIAGMLMAHEEGTLDLAERLKDHIGSRAVLLILDGCERVMSACAALGDLVAACPHLTVIATSREPLHLQAEHVMRVAPLPVPDLDNLPPTEQLATLPSVALFLQRAQSVRLDFQLTDANARDVAEICVQMEGLPLAIVLAAAQVRFLSPSAIARRLLDDPAVLKERVRDLPGRQHSIVETVEWTYQQLDEHERSLFRHLSTFAGGFGIDAATEVAAPEISAAELLIRLAVLVDKSLVLSTVLDDGEPRFSIPAVVRSFGRTQLSLHGEQDDACERHVAHYLLLAERAALEMNGNEQDAWLARLDQEQENIRAALRWVQESGDSTTELRLVCALAGYWRIRGSVRMGLQALQSALGRERDDDEGLRAHTLSELGLLLIWIGDYERALSVQREALETASRLADGALETRARTNLGAALLAEGRFADARQMLDEALSSWQDAQDAPDAAQIVLYLATLALAEGDVARGEAHAAESLTVFQSLGDARAAASALTVLAQAAAARGDASTAAEMLRDGLHEIRRLNEPQLLGGVMEEVAALASSVGSLERAAQLLAGADAVRSLAGLARTAYERERYNATQARLSLQLTRSALVQARARGMAAFQDELIDAALATLDEVQSSTAVVTVRRTAPRADMLSRREHQVLELVAQGMSNRQIADKLVISENTAKFHVTSILNKLGANSRAQIVALAARSHLLKGPLRPLQSS